MDLTQPQIDELHEFISSLSVATEHMFFHCCCAEIDYSGTVTYELKYKVMKHWKAEGIAEREAREEQAIAKAKE